MDRDTGVRDDLPAKAVEADGPKAEHSLAVSSHLLRTIYWGVWFVALPMALAIAFLWLLTPATGAEHPGLLGTIETFIREQPVPVAIVAFTVFEMSLWGVRNRLPLWRHAHPPLRADLPERLRPSFERARTLIDEAELISRKHDKAILRELSAKERTALRTKLDALSAELDRPELDEEALLDALSHADTEVDARLRRWRKSEAREYAESILLAVAVALALRAFVVEAFKIPSGSMIPTLQVGDHIFVAKYVYGAAIPWTNKRVLARMPPSRADVIVFAFPERPEQDFIKRVVAIPGDRLEARGSHPWINGWEVPHCYVGVYAYNELDTLLGKHEGDLFVEYLEDQTYLTLYDRTTPAQDYQGPYTVKPGEVWVMGDNRNNSHDSRMWFGGQGGGVPFGNIRGRALFVWLSVADGGIDWSRLGAPVMGRPRLPVSMRGLEGAVDKCIRERPPRAKTTPPKPAQ